MAEELLPRAGRRCSEDDRSSAMIRGRLIFAALVMAGGVRAVMAAGPELRPVTITVHAAGAPSNTFVPETTFGAGVDGRELGDAARTFTPHNLKAMRSAGFGPLTYRLRTELAIEAWHWNAKGHWSDPSRQQGYWTSSKVPAGPLPDSFGYRLPRRGSTTDQANNDGYSRIDDGDLHTYWKSNPYLDEAFTRESNDRHPQWISIDFGKPTAVNAFRIAWGEPFATEYAIEYCSDLITGEFAEKVPQCWVPFPKSDFESSSRRSRVDVVAPQPVRTRFVRILLTRSCRCLSRATEDIRDRVGYAVREIEAGVLDGRGHFHDAMRHAPKNRKQTEVVVSSTDPWHRAADVDRRTEQPSFDRVFASGLTSGQPVLVPVSALYDTPENAAAEVAYLLARGYPITNVEVGEEPDGQYATPEDYGALFIQVVEAIHAVAPAVKLGGPSFQTTVTEYTTMQLHGDGRTWLRRFLEFIGRRGHLGDYSFFSFEWYPFDDGCAGTAHQLAEHPAILSRVLERLQRDGLSRDIPWFISEYGYSAFGCRAEVDIEGALLNAETVGLFLTLGGDRVYLYGFEPGSLMDELSCNSWGNNAMFLADEKGEAAATTAIYWAARLINEQWVQPGGGVHQVFAAESDAVADGQPMVTAFAVRRPDGTWGLLVINKDPLRQYRLSFDFDFGGSGERTKASGDIDLYRYSREQYEWKADGPDGRAVVNAPPRYDRLRAGEPIFVPPYSISVVRLAATSHHDAPAER